MQLFCVNSGCQKHNMSTARDRCRGLIVGLAAGDRNGGPQRMAAMVCDALLSLKSASSSSSSSTFDAAALRSAVLSRYLAWVVDGKAFDTGTVFANVADFHLRGMTIDAAAHEVHRLYNSAGVNAAHRNIVISAARWLRNEELAAAATAESTLTHLHDDSISTAIACNTIARSLIEGNSIRVAVELALSNTKNDLLRGALLESLVNDDQGKATPDLHKGGHSPLVLRAALHFVFNGSSFDEALSLSIAFAGPANFCPVLVGAFAGCIFGGDAVARSRLLDHHLCDPQLRDGLADSLAADW